MVDDAVLRRAGAELRAGRPIVIPTDTVYGIAAFPAMTEGVDAIFRLKGRPRDKALPVVASAIEQFEGIAVFDDASRRLAARLWPGPVTLVVARARSFDVDLGGTDDSTVAVRIPADDDLTALTAAVGPLAVTSANRSGEPASLTCDGARAAFGSEVGYYLDAGPRPGIPSTVVSVSGEDLVVLREGPITADDLYRALKP